MAGVSPVYFDSALIAKFYVNEPGRQIVRDLALAAGRVVSSAIATAEVSAAFHRQLREGSVTVATFRALLGQFMHDAKGGLWTFVPITEAVTEGVQTLFAGLDPSVYLRSLDALHLVTAKAEKFTRVYSNDKRLLEACPALGLTGENPLP